MWSNTKEIQHSTRNGRDDYFPSYKRSAKYSNKSKVLVIDANMVVGMFLYARVVLENLLNQTKLSRLRQEIEPGTFPQGIEKA